MNLQHKIGKLFNGEGIVSARRHVRRWFAPPRFPLNRNRTIQTIDLDKFVKIRQRYQADPVAERWSKFLDLDRWIDINLTRIRRTGLDAKSSQQVLDLGCGASYFIYIAQLLGHDCVGLDTGEQPMFAEITRLLGVQHVVWRIQPFVPLPSFDKKFNLITAYRIYFNNHKRNDLWGVSEWEFFLDDLAKHLAPKGRIWLELNREHDGSFYTSKLKGFFASRGAKIVGSRVLFSS